MTQDLEYRSESYKGIEAQGKSIFATVYSGTRQKQKTAKRETCAYFNAHYVHSIRYHMHYFQILSSIKKNMAPKKINKVQTHRKGRTTSFTNRALLKQH